MDGKAGHGNILPHAIRPHIRPAVVIGLPPLRVARRAPHRGFALRVGRDEARVRVARRVLGGHPSAGRVGRLTGRARRSRFRSRGVTGSVGEHVVTGTAGGRALNSAGETVRGPHGLCSGAVRAALFVPASCESEDSHEQETFPQHPDILPSLLIQLLPAGRIAKRQLQCDLRVII